jgi:hypothetical protein
VHRDARMPIVCHNPPRYRNHPTKRRPTQAAV